MKNFPGMSVQGLAVVAFAVLARFGATALSGIPFSPLAGSVVPFLALGLGIDDVFVLVNILRNFLEDPTLQALSAPGDFVPEREMRLTVALAGPSNPMPVAQWFCWKMGLTATVHTLGMLLIFMPIMALDARRVKEVWYKARHWWLIRVAGIALSSLQPAGLLIAGYLLKHPLSGQMKRREKLGKLMEDTARWNSLQAFWSAVEEGTRRRLAREKTDVILKAVVRRFFNEKEVTSTLVMDALYSGCKLDYRSRNKKGKMNGVDMEEAINLIVWVDKDAFVLAGDVLLLLERVVSEMLQPYKDDKGPQNRTKV